MFVGRMSVYMLIAFYHHRVKWHFTIKVLLCVCFAAFLGRLWDPTPTS